MPFALIEPSVSGENGRVAQIEDSRFDVHPNLIWVLAGGDITTDWTYNFGTGTLEPPIPEPPLTREERIAEILESTEVAGEIARKLEDVIEALKDDPALSQEAKDWSTDRQTKRDSIT